MVSLFFFIKSIQRLYASPVLWDRITAFAFDLTRTVLYWRVPLQFPDSKISNFDFEFDFSNFFSFLPIVTCVRSRKIRKNPEKSWHFRNSQRFDCDLRFAILRHRQDKEQVKSNWNRKFRKCRCRMGFWTTETSDWSEDCSVLLKRWSEVM